MPDARVVGSDGLTFQSSLSRTNGTWTLQAILGNDGPQDAWVVPGCPQLFRAGMSRDGTHVAHEPSGGCAGVWRVIHVPPGWWMEQTLSWNETVFTGQDRNRYDPAPAGAYTWTVEADAIVGDPSSGSRRSYTTPFEVIVQ